MYYNFKKLHYLYLLFFQMTMHSGNMVAVMALLIA